MPSAEARLRLDRQRVSGKLFLNPGNFFGEFTAPDGDRGTRDGTHHARPLRTSVHRDRNPRYPPAQADST
jgi:hypothetical protein